MGNPDVKDWQDKARQIVEKTISPFCSFVDGTGDPDCIYPDGALLCNAPLPLPFLTKHRKSCRASQCPCSF